jgi:PKD repeat protein
MKPKLLIPLFLALSIALVIVSMVSADTTAEILYPTAVDGSACIGSNVVYDFRITNEGTIATVFSISYASIWTNTGPTFTPQLDVGEFYDFQVSVYIPWAAEPGDFDTLTLSVIGGGFSESATVTTTASFLNDWVDGANTPRGVRWPSVVYSGGYLYKIGGDNAGAQKWLDIYNTGTDIWSPGSDMPGARFWIDCEVISGKIYCGGGFTNRAETTLYIYDIASNTWSTGPELPYGVYSYASAALNGKYYLIGGIKSGSGYTNTVLVYNPASFSWDTTRASMSTARRMHSAGVINGKIYVAGGYNGSFLATVEVYDPELNAWSNIASLPSPWVNAADGINLDRYLILAGGSPDSITSSSAKALIYDSETNTWSWLPNMDHAIYGAEGDSDGTHFWLSSGQIFIDVWTASPYTTLMDVCATTCPSPVSGADFTWYPPDPWTGYTVELTATTSSGSPVINFSWAFDDGNFGTGKSIDHIFDTPLTYTVELTASNCDGASVSTQSHDIIVVDPPTIEASPTGLEATLLPDQTTQRQLQLCNNGGAPLEWVMSEVDTLPLQSNGELPWLSESPVNGVIPAESCMSIDIFFSSIGLSEGIYVGNLSINSTDPVNPLTNVPVSLTVSSSAIELIKTVGLIDNACGTTDQLNVYMNTTVYYCYTVTNTGGVILDLHNLTDDQLGELLNSFNYLLTPGASIYVISDGVPITKTVTNVATWYAEYEEHNATDTDTATVTVIPDPDFWVYLPTILKIPAP